MGNPAHVRNFESVLAALAERGHEVTVWFEERKAGADEPGLEFVERLRERYGTVRWDLQPRARLGAGARLRTVLEAAQDYLRYFDPPYREPGRLRSRALAFLPDGLERVLAAGFRSWPRARRALPAAARRLADRLEDPPGIRRELESRRPRALLVTPMVQFRSRQASWVRAARRLGIGTMACIYSWDSLTNRGLMHAKPDRVAVWNDVQARHAIELHAIDADSIVVAGAWPYDHWFDWQPSRSREDFCRELGLPAQEAILLYACSSPFIAANERDAVAEWLRAVRSSPDPRVASASVVVRPHPLNAAQWAAGAPGGATGVVVFPPDGADPVDQAARADYFDSLFHADAVVGVNTSALIEGPILDRPTVAFPAPRFRSTQEELPHFRPLAGSGGAVRASGSMAEHLEQLSEALADPGRDEEARRRFVDALIRPGAGDPPPTDRVVAVVEKLAS